MKRTFFLSLLGFSSLALSAPFKGRQLHNGSNYNLTETIKTTVYTTICPITTALQSQTTAVVDSTDTTAITICTQCTSKPTIAVESNTSKSSTATYVSMPTPAATNLALKRDWALDGDDLSQLNAIKSCRMLYTDNEVESGTKPAAGTPLAWVTMPNMTYPTVQLVNSNYFKKVWCHGSTIKMEFNSQTAYDYAWNNWHDEVRQTSDYIVVTSEPSCMGSSAGRERHFLRAKTEERDNSTKTITCEVEPIPIQDAVGDDNPVVVDVEEFSTRNTDKGFNVQANDFAGDDTVVNTTDVIRTIGGDSKFDEVLDKQIGIISIEDLNASTKEQFDISIDDFYGESDLPDLARNAILKRKIGDRIKKAVAKVKTAVKQAVAAVKEVVKEVITKVVEVAKAVADKIAELTTLDKNINIDIDFDTKQIGSVVTTPFDGAPGYKLFSAKTKSGKGTFEGFCVDCGIEGDFKIGGKFVFIFSRLKLEEGFITMRGDMGAALQLGLVGSFGFEGSKDKNVTTVNKNGEVFVVGVEKPVGVLPITPFLIPGIFSFGPQLKLDLGVDVELEAEGKILMGVRADWPSIDAKVDFVDKSKSSASGFKPIVTPVFEFETEAKLTIAPFLKFSAGVGIEFFNGKFGAQIALVDKPSLQMTAAAGFSGSLEKGFVFGTSDCKGIEVGVSLQNDVFVEVFGQEFPITTSSFELLDECINIGLKTREIYPITSPLRRRAIGDTTYEGGYVSQISTRDSNNTLLMRYSPNGNTYGVPAWKKPDQAGQEWTSWFASDISGAYITGDSHGRFFHGYQDTISAMGISRLRLHLPDEMPKTAQLMVLPTYIDDEDTTGDKIPYLMVADLGGEVFFPIMCMYANGAVYPKMFLANDTTTGVNMLMSNTQAVMETVTGGKVSECGYVPLTNNKAGSDIDLLD